MTTGLPIEQATHTLPGQSFDLILSIAVGEHLRDVEQSFDEMNSLLTPGGVQAHQIDLRDHGLFSHYGLSPLEWLTTGERVHELMTRHSGGPNRVMLPDYRRILERSQCAHQIRISRVAGAASDLAPYPEALRSAVDYDASAAALVAEIRPRLARRFRDWPETDLLPAGIFLRAQRP